MVVVLALVIVFLWQRYYKKVKEYCRSRRQRKGPLQFNSDCSRPSLQGPQTKAKVLKPRDGTLKPQKPGKLSVDDLERQGVTLEGFVKGKPEVFVKTSAHDSIIRFPIVQYDIIKRFIIRLRDSKGILNSK